MKKETGKRITKQQIRAGAAGILFVFAVLCYAASTHHTEQVRTLPETEQLGLEREEAERPGAGLEAEGLGVGLEAERPGAGLETERLKSGLEVKEPESVYYVYVCGAVRQPGVYPLAEGSRIWEAVEAAGGLTEEASDTAVNLAQLLKDGEQIWIPTREEQTAGTGLYASSEDGRVNLNTASKERLMTLSGIGEARAEAILAYREEFGAFETIEDIMKVSGIKESAFQKIKDDITV